MCALPIYIILTSLVVGAVVLMNYRASRGLECGDVSGVYRLTLTERCIAAIPVIGIVIPIAAICLMPDAILSALDKVSSSSYGNFIPVAFFAYLIGLAKLSSIVTASQLRRWLMSQGLQLIEIKQDRSFSLLKMGRTRALWGQPSETQSCVRVCVKDSRGNVSNANILWGKYCGIEWLSGTIGVRIMLEESDESEDDTAPHTEANKKDPNELLKPRW